jgi:hypothetical protein
VRMEGKSTAVAHAREAVGLSRTTNETLQRLDRSIVTAESKLRSTASIIDVYRADSG